jgi:hypothetical protein
LIKLNRPAVKERLAGCATEREVARRVEALAPVIEPGLIGALE